MTAPASEPASQAHPRTSGRRLASAPFVQAALWARLPLSRRRPALERVLPSPCERPQLGSPSDESGHSKDYAAALDSGQSKSPGWSAEELSQAGPPLATDHQQDDHQRRWMDSWASRSDRLLTRPSLLETDRQGGLWRSSRTGHRGLDAAVRVRRRAPVTARRGQTNTRRTSRSRRPAPDRVPLHCSRWVSNPSSFAGLGCEGRCCAPRSGRSCCV